MMFLLMLLAVQVCIDLKIESQNDAKLETKGSLVYLQLPHTATARGRHAGRLYRGLLPQSIDTNQGMVCCSLRSLLSPDRAGCVVTRARTSGTCFRPGFAA
jgi:hypothetical protein